MPAWAAIVPKANTETRVERQVAYGRNIGDNGIGETWSKHEKPPAQGRIVLWQAALWQHLGMPHDRKRIISCGR